MGRRNIQGGNKAKAMARSSGYQSNELRKKESEEEEYAIVTAVSGSGRFRVTSENKKNYVAILPGSMRGSKKRNNHVQLESIILINNRSTWQTVKDLAHVDIAHVYSSNHINELGLKKVFESQLNAISKSGRDDLSIDFQNITPDTEDNSNKVIVLEKTEENDVDLDLI